MKGHWANKDVKKCVALNNKRASAQIKGDMLQMTQQAHAVGMFPSSPGPKSWERLSKLSLSLSKFT